MIIASSLLWFGCLHHILVLGVFAAGVPPEAIDWQDISSNIDKYPVLKNLVIPEEVSWRSVNHKEQLKKYFREKEKNEDWIESFHYEDCHCGKENGQWAERIVGGSETGMFQYPWQAAVLLERPEGHTWSLICGGSLITSRHVITAAHCLNIGQVTEGFPNNFAVLLGKHNLKDTTEDSVAIRSLIEGVHPLFKGAGTGFDVGVIVLSKSVNLTTNPHIKPICLPDPSDYRLFDQWKAQVTGWGLTAYKGNMSPVLNQATMTIMPLIKCGFIYHNYLSWSNICAGGDESGSPDSCSGDSGGPLSVNINGTRLQVGIVSWGIKCATPGFPGVYTRLSGVMDYIHFVMNYTSEIMINYSICHSDLSHDKPFQQ